MVKYGLFITFGFVGSFALCACGGDDTLSVQASDGGASDSASPTGLVIDTTAIDFGHADCGGTAPAAKSIHLANGTSNAVHWNATINGSAIFSVTSPANASLPPGASVDISLAAAAFPATTPFAKTETATVTVFTDDPNHFQTTIPVLMTASGASLSLSKASLDFGEVPLGTTSMALTETVSNVGDEPITFTAPRTAKSFSLAWASSPSDLSLGASASAQLTSTYAATSTSSTTGSFPFTVKTGHLCGAPPILNVVGQGTTGALSFQPGALDFGLVDCGTTSSMTQGDRTITITNSGNQTLTWQAGLRRAPNSFYDIATTGTTLAAGASGTIVVTPHAIPQPSSTANDFYADGIYVTTDVPLDVPHLIELHETAYGAILVATADDVLTFKNGSVGRQMTSPIQVTNVGNAIYQNGVASVSGSGFGLASDPYLTPLVPGDSAFQTVTFLPTDSSPSDGALSFTHAGPASCGVDLSLPLHGIVTEPSVFIPVTSFRFQDVTCGAMADPQSISVINTTADSLHLISTIDDDVEFAASPQQTDVAAGASQIITVAETEPAFLGVYHYGVTINQTTAPGYFVDSPITLDTRSARLDATGIDFGAQPIGSDAQIRFTIFNSGTSTAGVVLPENVGDFSFEILSPSILPGDTTTVIAHFHPTTSTASAEDASLSLSEETVVCPDFPPFGPIHLTGTGIDNAVVVAPTYVDLGRDPCGAPSQPVVIANHGSVAFNWSARLNGTFFDSGSLAANTAATITVSNAAALQFNHLESLEITTDLAGDLPHEVGVYNNKQPSGLPPVVCP
jgi:hypothetical protein